MALLSAIELMALLDENLPRVDRRGEVIEEIGEDFIRLRLHVQETYLSLDLPAGSGQVVLSAPVMIGLADTAMYSCVHAFYGREVFAAIVSLNVSFFRIAGAGELSVLARILRRGKALAFLEAHLYSGAATEPCGHVTATYAMRSMGT